MIPRLNTSHKRIAGWKTKESKVIKTEAAQWSCQPRTISFILVHTLWRAGLANVARRLAIISSPRTCGTPLSRNNSCLKRNGFTLAHWFRLVIVGVFGWQRKITTVICKTYRMACVHAFRNDHWFDNNIGWTSTDATRLTTILAHTSYSRIVATTQRGSYIRTIASLV